MKSSDTPALAEFEGKLWMAYRGATTTNLFVCSGNGSSWGEQTRLTPINGAATSVGPALAAYGDRLWLVYRGEGLSSSNIFACFFTGQEWPAITFDITAINGARTLEAPRLGVLGDLLWLVYKDEASSDMWSCAYDGTTWLDRTRITVQNDAKTSKSIGVAPLKDVLVAAYCGQSASGNIYSCSLQQDAKLT